MCGMDDRTLFIWVGVGVVAYIATVFAEGFYKLYLWLLIENQVLIAIARERAGRKRR